MTAVAPADRPVHPALCGPCSGKWLRCLDLRPPPPPVRIMTIGRDLPRDVEAARQRRFSQWAEVVREYAAQLERDCAAGKHACQVASEGA